MAQVPREYNNFPKKNAYVVLPEVLEGSIKDIVAIDLLEQKMNMEYKWNKEERKLRWAIGPHEICSFEIILK